MTGEPFVDFQALVLARMQEEGTGTIADVVYGTLDMDAFVETANRIIEERNLGGRVGSAKIIREGGSVTLEMAYQPEHPISFIDISINLDTEE